MNKFTIIIMFSFPISLFCLQSYHEIAIGYGQDLEFSMAIRVEDSSMDYPLFIQGRGGYIFQMDPGNAEDARKIFINDNQGGSIQEYGESIFLAMDLGYKLTNRENISLEITLSGLWNHYRAHFAYIGNNEAFTVKTSPLGIGAGINLRLPFSGTGSSLILKGGAEYYPKTKIDAHGTYYYNPDSQDDNARNNYTYQDADEAINQPETRFFVQIGILYPIGE